MHTVTRFNLPHPFGASNYHVAYPRTPPWSILLRFLRWVAVEESKNVNTLLGINQWFKIEQCRNRYIYVIEIFRISIEYRRRCHYRVLLRVHETLTDWPSRQCTVRSFGRSFARPAPIRSICFMRDHAITRVACRDPGRGNARACFQGDSPQPTVAPCPPPRSSTTLRNPEQGWPGASVRAWYTEIPPSKRVFFSRFRGDCDLLYSLSLFVQQVPCLRPGPGEQVILLLQCFFHYNLSSRKYKLSKD